MLHSSVKLMVFVMVTLSGSQIELLAYLMANLMANLMEYLMANLMANALVTTKASIQD